MRWSGKVQPPRQTEVSDGGVSWKKCVRCQQSYFRGLHCSRCYPAKPSPQLVEE